MSHKAAGAILVIVLILAVVAAAFYVSYRSIRVTIEDVSFGQPPVTLSPARTLASVITFALTGDVLSLLGAIEFINLRIRLLLENPSFLPLPLGPIRYELLINEISVATGLSDQSVTIPPGGHTSIEVTQATRIPSFERLVSSIITSRGVLRLRVQGTVEAGGFLKLQIPFSVEDSLDLVQGVKSAAPSVTTPSPPIMRYLVLNVEWQSGGSMVIKASPGMVVTAYVDISATTDFNGNILIDVRKDLTGLPDASVQKRSEYITVKASEVKRCQVTITVESSTLLRGYFVEVTYDGEKWTMPSSYPPRLKVN